DIASRSAIGHARGDGACLLDTHRASRVWLAAVSGAEPLMKLSWRTLLAFAHDMAACAVAWAVAFWLRFTPEKIPDEYLDVGLSSLPWAISVFAVLFWSL